MSWYSQIQKDHKEIKSAFEHAIQDPSEPNITKARELLLAHAYAEEKSIYPSLKKHQIGDSDLLSEQHQAEEEIKHINSKTKDVKEKLSKLLQAVLEHAISHEEKDKFKQLREKLGIQQNLELGSLYKQHYHLK
jgi:hemerythrin superfamily protein